MKCNHESQSYLAFFFLSFRQLYILIKNIKKRKEKLNKNDEYD